MSDEPLKPIASNWHCHLGEESTCSICGAVKVHRWEHRTLPDGENVEVRRYKLGPGGQPLGTETYWQRRYAP